MKILMISDVYFPRINGVSTSIQTFRRELARLGHETTLIAPAYPARYRDEPGLIRIPSRYLPMDPEDRLMQARAIRALVPQLRKQRFDLVHIQTPFVAHYLGKHLAACLQVPRVETYHTFFEEYLFHYVPFLPGSWMRGLARWFSRNQCNRLDALIVPSCAMREVLARYGVRVPMHVIPTGIALAEFAGEGPARDELRRSSQRLGLDTRVRFVGYLDRRGALLDCYRAADALVFASRTETQGLVLLEAMALGVPVISTAVMGTKDILGPGRGALVPEDDEAAFAQTMVRLMHEEGLRQRLAQEAKDYAREWHAGAMAQRLLSLYRTMAERSNPVAAASRAASPAR